MPYRCLFISACCAAVIGCKPSQIDVEIRGMDPVQTAHTSIWMVEQAKLVSIMSDDCATGVYRRDPEKLKLLWAAVKKKAGEDILDYCAQQARPQSCTIDLSMAYFGAIDVMNGESSWSNERSSAARARPIVLEYAARQLLQFASATVLAGLEMHGDSLGALGPDGTLSVRRPPSGSLLVAVADTPDGLLGAEIAPPAEANSVVVPYDASGFALMNRCMPKLDSAGDP